MLIPKVHNRLNCLAFKLSFADDFLVFNKYVVSLKDAMLLIRDSGELKQLIVIMLKIGNYLNFGTKKGSASNFTLELFGKLSMTKRLKL